MLKVKDLKRLTRSGHPKLFTNANDVGVGFGKAYEGEDPRGYYWGIKGTAKSSRKAGKKKKPKRQKTWEMRFYYPKKGGASRLAAQQIYIPEKLRKNDYIGPDSPPDTTEDTFVWVFCTCEYFLFACELADAERDASTLNPSWHKRALDAYDESGNRITENNGKGYGQGKTGRSPNPSGTPRLCKHLISAIDHGVLDYAPVKKVIPKFKEKTKEPEKPTTPKAKPSNKPAAKPSTNPLKKAAKPTGPLKK